MMLASALCKLSSNTQDQKQSLYSFWNQNLVSFNSSGFRRRQNLDLRGSSEHERRRGEVVHLGNPNWSSIWSHSDATWRSGDPLQCHSCVTSYATPMPFHAIPLPFLCIPMPFLCHSSAIPMSFLCHTYAIPMPLLCHSYAVPPFLFHLIPILRHWSFQCNSLDTPLHFTWNLW
jgi:hypothetical protein